jgi:hypothetical protein
MTYLLQHAQRAPSSGARVDERTLLNLPDFDGGAFVRVFVEDTSDRRVRRFRRLPQPRLRLRVGDCAHEIFLEFAVDSAAKRENSLHKADTLLAAVHRFRHALQAEADLYAAREHARTGCKGKEARR